MKFRRLPPLHTLEAFEASARELSFKTAADQLHLTASAVSHQIKALEDFLGFDLFRRGNRSLELTAGGRDYLEVVRDTLRRLRDGSQRVSERHGRTTLKISMGAFIASEIIMPALPEFQAQHPDIDVHIETSLRNVDLLHEDVDVALRFSGGHWPKLTAHRMLQVDAVPVCDAATAQRLATRSPTELDDVALIHSSPLPGAWSMWAQSAGVALGKPRNDLHVDSYFALLRAAEQGLGLALGLQPIIQPWLKSGRLAMPWPQLRISLPHAYHLLHRPGDANRREVQAFRDWLLELLSSGRLFG